MKLCFCERCGKEKEQKDMFNIYRQVCQKCHDEGLTEYREYDHRTLGDWHGRFGTESEDEQEQLC